MIKKHPYPEQSWNEFLATLGIGDEYWHEVDQNNYNDQMRILNTPKSRRPENLKGKEFTTRLFRGVPQNPQEEVIFLIKLKRVK